MREGGKCIYFMLFDLNLIWWGMARKKYAKTIKYADWLTEFNRIIGTFPTVTVRQLFYQMTVSGIITNCIADYKRMDAALVKARDNNDVDWSIFEDDSRTEQINRGDYTSIEEFKYTIKNQWKNWNNYTDIWKNQDVHLEIFIEKNALLNQVNNVAEKYQVNVCPVKGYSSYTYLGKQGDRLNNYSKVVILYIGDFDPSGLDIQRSIEQRLNSYSCGNYTMNRIALTWNQIQQLQLPSYFVKLKDTRSKDFISKYGNNCWETEALSPTDLAKTIEDEILKYFDTSKYQQLLKEIESDKQTLKEWLNRQ